MRKQSSLLNGFALTFVYLIVTAPISAPSAGNTAFASSCALEVTEPTLRSVHSSLAEATKGDQIIVSTSATGCIDEVIPFVVIVEIRNKDGVTEDLGWQSGTLEGKQTVEIGMSWIPRHGGSYQLRTFAISDLTNPLVLSFIAHSNITIANSDKVFVVIPYDPDPSLQESNFEPDFIKVILDYNSTVRWTNGDNASHRLVGDQTLSNSKPLAFEEPAFLYPGYFVEHTFTETGLFQYRDSDRGWMGGYVQVYPSDAINASLSVLVNGLQDSYSLEEPMQVTVDVNGYETGCGTFHLFIEKIIAAGEKPFTWSTIGHYDCIADPPFGRLELHFPTDTWEMEVFNASPYINQTGTYRLTASFEGTLAFYSLSREFRVTE